MRAIGKRTGPTAIPLPAAVPLRRSMSHLEDSASWRAGPHHRRRDDCSVRSTTDPQPPDETSAGDAPGVAPAHRAAARLILLDLAPRHAAYLRLALHDGRRRLGAASK